MITTTPRWHINVVKTIITLIEILHHTLTILWYQEDESILNKKNNNNCCSLSLYLLVRYEHDVQDAINILWTAYSCLGISTAFSLPDMIIILLFQVTSFKESFFFIKVQINCQSLTNWVGLLYASGIGKPDLCCYCAAEGIQQQQDNDLRRSTELSCLYVKPVWGTKTQY
jgi:hypothetical protein